MFEYNREVFYTICIILGIFWAIVETLIAFWLYKIYKIVKSKQTDDVRSE